MDELVMARIVNEIRESRDPERRIELLKLIRKNINESHLADIKTLVENGPMKSEIFKNRVRLRSTGLVVCVVCDSDPRYLAATPTAYELVNIEE